LVAEPLRITRQQSADMAGFINVTNEVFQQFVSGTRRSLARSRGDSGLVINAGRGGFRRLVDNANDLRH
jgi:hypothetical protein